MLTAREARELHALARRRERERRGRFLAEGVRVVEDLLTSRLQVHWLVAASTLEDTDRGARLLEAARADGLPIRTIDAADFDRLAATEHPQGVLAVASIPRTDWDGIALDEPAPTLLVLDAVQDPGNFGTLVRSAEALGAAGVIALPGTVDPWNPKAVRSAAGSSFRIPILSLDWPAALEGLKARGFRVFGAALDGEPLGREGAARTAIVVGNEGAGLTPAVRSGVDRLVRIPLRGRAESLNVAAAAAILLYEVQRDASGREGGSGHERADLERQPWE